MPRWLRIGAGALALVAALSIWAQASTAPASVGGTEGLVDDADAGFRTLDLTWHDAARVRQVPVRLYWPNHTQDRKLPLVVFSHGIGSSLDGYTHLGRYWAAHGIASLHLQHIGSDRRLWRGGVLSVVSQFRQATTETEAIARVQDLRFALDRLLAGSLGPSINHDAIVAAGHSYGANTSLLAAGAAPVRDGRTLDFHDPRIAAAILISAPPFYGEPDQTPILQGITVPTLHITTRADIIRIPGFGSGPDDRIRVFEATGSALKVLAVFRQGSHNVFTDERHFDSVGVSERVKRDTRTLTLAFRQQILGAEPRALAHWGQGHGDRLARYTVQDDATPRSWVAR